MAKTAKSIEQQLVSEDAVLLEEETLDPYFSLENARDDGNYLSLDADDDFKKPGNVVKTLFGEEAMKFLGLPARPHCHLKRGDCSRIFFRFQPLIERLQKRGDANVQFWDQIEIRVWNKQNLKILTPTIIRGLPTADCPSFRKDNPDWKPAEYQGDYMRGSHIIDFLSEVEHATKWREYLVQVISVNVTEDMSYAEFR